MKIYVIDLLITIKWRNIWMNMDFHYYGTYLAARIAGYAKAESNAIAYAAQFVDDCYIERLDKSGIKEPRPTSENPGAFG